MLVRLKGEKLPRKVVGVLLEGNNHVTDIKHVDEKFGTYTPDSYDGF